MKASRKFPMNLPRIKDLLELYPCKPHNKSRHRTAQRSSSAPEQT